MLHLFITRDIAAEYEGAVMLGVFNLDRAAVAASFRRLAALDVDVACFGHGEPVLDGAAARLQEAAAGLVTE